MGTNLKGKGAASNGKCFYHVELKGILFPGKGQYPVERIDLLLLYPVNFIDVKLKNMPQAPVIKPAQAVVRNSFKTASNFVKPPDTRIKPVDPIGNRPLNRAVVACAEMEKVYFTQAAPIPPEKLIPLVYQ